MSRVIGVNLRTGGVKYFEEDGSEVKVGDKVVVETKEGTEFGEVVKEFQKVANYSPRHLRPILRRADDDDLRQVERIEIKEMEAFTLAQEKIFAHGLPMEIIKTECTFDEKKVTFNFTAEGRVDFRELVKDLASIFKVRIELHQVGVRDKAKRLSGIGPCGFPLCCNTFLKDFASVSVRMAKEQGLPLNPVKISGACGRLLCCLSYENENYLEVKKRLPPLGSWVETPQGEGRIVEINVPKESLIVEVGEGAKIEVRPSEVRRVSAEEGSRTPTREPSHGPEPGASTSSATSAKEE